MNDRMSDMDALVELAAEALDESGLWPKPDERVQEFKERAARAALLAIGLPALLERVEAAEGARAKPTTWSTGLRRLENLLADEWGDDLAITYETFCTAYRSARAFESDNTERADFRTALDASETP